MEYRDVKLEDLKNISKEIVDSILNISNSEISEDRENSFVIYLEGDMGAGKTTLAQNIGRSLGISDHMQSPTFTLMREYDLLSEIVLSIKEENKNGDKFKEKIFKNKYKKLLHIDAYRFEDKKEGQILNLDENKKESIVLIEWPKNMHAPDADMIINIEKIDEDVRNIKVEIK